MLNYHVLLHLLFFAVLSLMNLNYQMVEICDNAMDDDGDGLIDLNDPECSCEIAEPKSLIPNASFEDMLCCPNSRGSLHCADTWIQASDATTDYIHTCGWMGWEDLPVPLPLPDGEACIGFRNGRFGQNPNLNWKEYTGACLSEPLRAGNSYRFQFHIGFTNYRNSPPLSVVFYGSPSCENLPFGIGDEEYGCPTNGPGWIALSTTNASGSNSWTVREFNVTPTEDIYAIAIGPNCYPTSAVDNPYYFLDNLILADVKEFEFTITGDTNVCAQDFTLRLPVRDSLEYQWYRDGIALVGETDFEYQPEQDGLYQVRVQGPSSCKITRPYLHSKPQSETEIQEYICEDGMLRFAGKTLDSGGVYRDTLKTVDGCDSIIVMNLTRLIDSTTHVQAKIMPGESFPIGDQMIHEPMSGQLRLTSSHGCDSTVHLELTYYNIFIPSAFTPNSDGINDRFQIYGTDELVGIQSLQIFDRWGGLAYSATDMDPHDSNAGWNGRGIDSRVLVGTYTYRAVLVTNDGLPHQVSGEVTLLP